MPRQIRHVDVGEEKVRIDLRKLAPGVEAIARDEHFKLGHFEMNGDKFGDRGIVFRDENTKMVVGWQIGQAHGCRAV